jgi:protein TilB
MKNLSTCPKIKELYLTGNPCENWEGFKDYVIASVPQLLLLNGVEILKSERIKAAQKFENLEKELTSASVENVIKKENDPDKDNPNKYTKEYRRKLYLELEEDKLKKEEDKKRNDKSWAYVEDFPTNEPSVYKDNGEIRICNQGKYDFFLDEDIFITGIMTFELKLPKFLDTANIQVDLNPQYIRVKAKDKVTQLRFDHEVIVEKSTIQRSTTTGHLLVKAPIVGITPKVKKEDETKKDRKNIKNIVNDNKKVLKPLDKNLDFNKGTTIQNVAKIESKLIKETVKTEEDDADFRDVNLDEIPDLD